MNRYVLIVTYNGSKWLEKCLSSLFLSDIGFHCLVVDNASTDKTKEIIHKYPQIELIESTINYGFGKANNIGIRHALSKGADAIFLLNQDAYVFPDTLRHLVNNLKSDSIISPLHYAGNSKDLDFGFLKYAQKYVPELLTDLGKNNCATTYETNFVNAAAWMLPKELIEQVGAFEPLFDHYGEDENYVQRVHFHKCRIQIVPASKVIHDRIQNSKGRKVDFRYLKTYLLVSALNILKPENSIIELSPSYWIKFTIYAIFDLIRFNKNLAISKFKVIKFYLDNKNTILKHRNLAKNKRYAL